ncbi:hypothetical protein CISIN_1g038318mg [Citrus sinensis]|uniref:Protein kinase domain-containing protein n=1 Tax=Citrus sinensis TaxID=2711 RepID=A0A067EHM9_CITSI|nr:hypothetical protein CISIN_1g038318mg [Citrus sinensis]
MLGSLTYLRTPHLGSNNLTSSISLSLWNVECILYIDLSSNSLSGFLPSNIEKLKVLVDCFGSLTSLEFLDISNNNLFGKIPKSFKGLSRLKQLNAAHSKLEEEIPIERPLRNILAQSFIWNYTLCGPPRLQVPSCKEDNSRGSKKDTLLILKYIFPLIMSIALITILILFCIRCRNRNISDMLNIMIDVALILEYVHHDHSTLMVHCDLKPDNILIDENM